MPRVNAFVMESEVLVEPEVSVTTPSQAATIPSSTEQTFVARIAGELAPQEMLFIFCGIVFSAVAIIASPRITQWPQVLLQVALSFVIIAGITYWCAVIGTKGSTGRWPRRIRILYLFPMVLWYFKISGLISYPLHGHDCDSILIAADKLLFGVNPTWWLFDHFPHWPGLTEYLMVCYSLFYFLPAALAFEFYSRRAREKAESSVVAERQMDQVIFVIIYAFLLSYICYFFLPAIGPRFTLHNFFDLSKDLPGIWLTEPLRAILNRGEGILPGMPMTQILQNVTRDAFPSGHTEMTLCTIILAFQLRARIRWPILVIGSSLIFATVYLRYHYVIDLVGGAVLAMVALYTWQWVRDRLLMLQARLVR